MEQEKQSLKRPGENNDELVERLKREALEEAEARRQAISREWEKHPERKEEFLARLQLDINLAKIDGWFEGWWDLDDDGNMIAPPLKFKISQFPEKAVMAHVMAAAGIFPSVSQARKNGWDKPLVTGEFVVTKKKIRIIVVD